MIKNDKQYQVTKKRLQEFSDALIDAQGREYIDPLLKVLEVNGLKGQIEDLNAEIKEYEVLKDGNVNYIMIDSPVEITDVLIKGRILRGWSHAELAGRVNLKEQQIQRYEASNYSTASFPRIQAIASALDLHFSPMKVQVLQQQRNISLNALQQASSLKIKLRRNKALLLIG